MKIFSKILNNVKPSASNTMSQIAREMQMKGRDIISLSSGEPDFDTPENIKKAALIAMKEGKTKYPPTAGILELREAVSYKLFKENKLSYSSKEIIIGNGAKQIIFNALMSTINPGDEVIIFSPYWVSYPEMIRLCQGVPIVINGINENNFKITGKLLEQSINNKTKWLIFNSPCNPTGSVYSYEEIKDLTDVLLKYSHIQIMEDDIYEKLIYDDNIFYTIPQVEPKLLERVLIINGVSKSHAMTGWRIGYAAGRKDLIQAMEVIQSQTTSGVSTISQWAAVAALTESQKFLKKWKKIFEERRNYIVNEINKIKGLNCHMPQGAFYVFPSCIKLINKFCGKNSILNDKDFTQNLLENQGIALVHGSAFGLKMHFRISYATSMEKLKEACSRIKKFCNSLKK